MLKFEYWHLKMKRVVTDQVFLLIHPSVRPFYSNPTIDVERESRKNGNKNCLLQQHLKKRKKNEEEEEINKKYKQKTVFVPSYSCIIIVIFGLSFPY